MSARDEMTRVCGRGGRILHCGAHLLFFVIGMAGCTMAVPTNHERLVLQIERLAEESPIRREVLRQATFVADPRLARLGVRYLGDDSEEVQLYALQLTFKDPANRDEAIVASLQHPNRLQRKAGAIAAGELRGSGNPRVDVALAAALESESDALVFSLLCKSLVLRDGSAGARRVHECVSTRDAAWRRLAVEALALAPEAAFHAVFREALDDGVMAIWGRRGLAALGALESREHVARLQTYGLEKSIDEYMAAYERHEAGLAGMRASSVGEMVRGAARADVVLLAESHFDGFERAWEIRILQDLCILAGGVDRVTLVCESRALQGPVMAAAAELGCPTVEAEADLEQQQERLRTTGWVLEQRDATTVARLLEVAGKGGKTVVVYGAAHTVGFEAALRRSGLSVQRIVLSPSGRMLAEAMDVEGGLRVAGKVYRCDDGTFVIPAATFGYFGCPDLDQRLDEEAAAAGGR